MVVSYTQLRLSLGIVHHKKKSVYRSDILEHFEIAPIVQSCIEYCLRRQECAAFSYSKSLHACNLHRESKNPVFTNNVEFEYYEVARKKPGIKRK